MWYLVLVLSAVRVVSAGHDNFLQECAKYYLPKNYLELLPNIPYLNQLPVPDNMQIFQRKEYKNRLQIEPSMTTKVLDVKTKYVYKSPVCVKFNKRQKLCKPEDGNLREDVEKLITKNDFLQNVEERVEGELDVLEEQPDSEEEKFNLKVSFDKLEPSESEESRAFGSKLRTPSMTPKIHELLIVDRLNQLETVLPNYHRKRVYETSTVFITKTLSNKRAMATLTVKNCVPLGYDVCPKKARRSSKLPKKPPKSNSWQENLFHFG